ncbi:hypothetical protein VP1G_10795 [Cytospora mali]|uniref:Uncharacterized protein n=1 Tax=Cytospora mali TaxID=578113 RepID=A0A194UWJ0_CYTMA|nr:hypothetical protein VP1G_10795 [Valsa mali var. pyri (nom. inval.)]
MAWDNDENVKKRGAVPSFIAEAPITPLLLPAAGGDGTYMPATNNAPTTSVL